MRLVSAHVLDLQHIECHTRPANDGSLEFGLGVIPWGVYSRTCLSSLAVASLICRYFSPTILLAMTGFTRSSQSVLTDIGKISIVD
jgi:hypothetical protein